MAPLARHQAVFEPKFATGFNYSRVMAFNKPRTLQGEIAALEREVDQHRRDMAEVEGNDGVAHGNVSDWLITSGRTLIDAFMRELKTFRKFYKKWVEKNSAE